MAQIILKSHWKKNYSNLVLIYGLISTKDKRINMNLVIYWAIRFKFKTQVRRKFKTLFQKQILQFDAYLRTYQRIR